MFQLIVLGILLSAAAINGSPVVPNRPAINYAAEARRLVHQANWASVGTISVDESTKGYPTVNVLSTADSKIGAASTGVIYFYMMDLDIAAMDIEKDNRVTFMFSDAQEGECNKKGLDPWSHHCPRTIISGQVQKVEKNTPEYATGSEAVLSRHPVLEALTSRVVARPSSSPPSPHSFRHELFLCKLNIVNVMVFSGSGRYMRVTPDDYYAANANSDDAGKI